ncbi:MAG: FkbM family methyltransferase [Brumimicrobium sp.]|nr:FkbM family methyltransferase [Brumimicrobium sp.]
MKSTENESERIQFDFRFRHKIIQVLTRIDLKGFRKLAHLAPKYLIPKPKSSGIIVLPNGIKLFIDPVKDKGIEEVLYYTGTYEAGTLSFMNKYLKKGDTFVDVGANIGIMSLAGSKIVGPEGKVISFEPHPLTADILRSNIALNKVENVKIFEDALGSQNGNAVIFDRWADNRGGASLVMGKEQEGRKIQMRTLSETIGAGKVDMIKIDVEGFELEVLKGSISVLKRDQPPILIVEFTENSEHESLSRKQLYDWLQSVNNKYRFFKLKGTKNRPSVLIEVLSLKDLPSHDNLFCIPQRF